jgi:maleate cis-trans isomerase
VEIVPTFVGFRRSDRQTFENAFERIEQIADDLQAVGCNIVIVSGTPPILLKGLDFERQWGDRLAQKIGLPVVTQMEPHALALLALGIQRVAIATYYGDELNDAIVRYFARFDIEGVVLGGLRVEGRQEALYTTSLRALDEVSYMQVYQYCKSGYQRLKEPVDGIYINGGGWDAPPAIDLLERDLGTKVVFALAAEMWATYKRLAIELAVADCGELLRDNPALPPRP